HPDLADPPGPAALRRPVPAAPRARVAAGRAVGPGRAVPVAAVPLAVPPPHLLQGLTAPAAPSVRPPAPTGSLPRFFLDLLLFPLLTMGGARSVAPLPRHGDRPMSVPALLRARFSLRPARPGRRALP